MLLLKFNFTSLENILNFECHIYDLFKFEHDQEMIY